ncbi:MAG TPA: hypothetical protein VNO30_36695 [Kofleriaceae bacterium]|nr:hypothetical protein [Kofleriaceae bacterium]
MTKTQPPRPILGIDIGRVIIGPVDDHGRADTSFLSGTVERAMQTPPAPGALDSIAQLARAFGGDVWLVSKCGAGVQAKTRRWLAHWRFWDVTGIAPDHLRFCLKRPQKADHCRELAITHFIDDRVDVLEHLRGLGAAPVPVRRRLADPPGASLGAAGDHVAAGAGRGAGDAAAGGAGAGAGASRRSLRSPRGGSGPRLVTEAAVARTPRLNDPDATLRPACVVSIRQGALTSCGRRPRR